MSTSVSGDDLYMHSCPSAIYFMVYMLRKFIVHVIDYWEIIFAVIWPLHIYHQKHPVNLILLALFTVSLSFTVGVSCAMTEGLCIVPFNII